MATTDRLLYISSDGLVRQLGFDPTAADLGGAAGVASSTHAATSKTTPVDADELPIVDSAASWGLKKLTWANLKATLKTYFDTLYLGISATAANASQLLGFTWASPGTIGSTTPNSGAFTTLSATGNVTLGDATTDTLNVGNGGIIKDASGLVGISATPTAAPACYLNVAQGVQATGTSPQMQLYASSAGAGLKYFRVVNDGSSGAINFQRVNDAYSTATNVFSIDSNNNVLIVGAGLGYGTGSGGTVTQATSRTTGVTLNKPTGAITLVSAAGSTSWQSFTVTNSLVAVTDVVRVVQKSGTDKYMIHVTNVAAGSFQITFATTGGTTTEQPVFNFAVIKGATS